MEVRLKDLRLKREGPALTPGLPIPSGGTSCYGRTSQKPRPKVEMRARVELGEM